ncbi:MAG: 4Fe-4S dicluster domain-containing protein [Lachnospiraceae bacterium]|nr:4Fe-4S dicluster domain-containing protein [Lachnospiraceae bacterium]
MITNDKNIVELKHFVLREVCRLAWAGSLTSEETDKIVYEVSPGPKAEYRCCVYKEREIVRGRIRLAMGECPEPGHESKNVVQVIPAACDDCPIQDYFVTDVCRFCLGKACLNACKFGAISPGDAKMHIDLNKCKSCGACAKACPFGAIVHQERPCKKACPVGAIFYDEAGICQIDESKCIHCGHCIHNCPFGAIGSKIYATDVIRAIQGGKRVIAMCAPATEGQFGKDITMAAIRAALKNAGFADMVEVGLGGDMTAAYEAKEWIEARKEGRIMTTSCCPAFISMLRHHFPKIYEENKSQTVSPMVAVARYLKALDPECVTVFIGPCIAKKGEAQNEFIKGSADYALTYGEIVAMLDAKDVTIEPVEEAYQEASIFGKKFAGSGGVANAVLEVMQEMGEDVNDIRVTTCAGGDECRKAMLLLKVGRLDTDFVEGMICPGGCVGGPSKHRVETEVLKARTGLLGKADDRKILENLKNYPMDKFSMFRDGSMPEKD